jgi:histidine ammonia-lyase
MVLRQGLTAIAGARISAESVAALGQGLLRFHGCGTGSALPVAAVRGAMLGTIAAREAMRELVGHAIAVHLLVAAQACELRGGLPSRPAVASVVRSIRKLSPELVDDRPLDGDIEAVYQAVVSGPLGLRVDG